MAKKSYQGAYLALRQSIKSGNPGQLYVFHGEEKYLLEDTLDALRRLIVPVGMEEFNYRTFSGKDVDVNALVDAIDCFPMMSERTLVVVTDFDLFGCNEEKRTLLTDVFSDLPEYVCLIFVYDTLELKTGRGKFPDLIKKVGSLVEFAPAGQADLIDWIRRQFTALDKNIDRKECEYLIFLCGGLMTGLRSEILKIATYAKGKNITQNDIDAVADPVLEARVFDMTDAVGNHQFERSLQILTDLYSLNEHPIKILSVLGRHLRQLYTARLALEARQGTPTVMDIWGTKSDWQANKLMQCAWKCSLDWCRKAGAWSGAADLAMKSSARDAEDILTELMLRLANG